MKIYRHIGFLKEVFLYTLSAFGGPQGHFGMMMKSFVQNKKYVTEEELFEYYSFCQILPGASSTQMISLIGYKRGGLLLAILTFIIWITPACVFMGLFSLFLTNYKNTGINDGIFKFIQPMAIAFLAFAALKGFSLSVKNTITQIIMIISVILTFIFFKSPWILPILIICGGIATNFSDKRIPDKSIATSRKIKWSNIILFLVIFGLAGVLSETARRQNWSNRSQFNLFENFYRFGSIVFGGGDVLFPMMLDQYVARPTNQKVIEHNPNAIKIKKEDLLIGYGIVRAIPGPVFSYASFAGGMALEKEGKNKQIIGCIIGAVAIFLPSALLVFFFFPIWQNLKKYIVVYRALEGINAVVVGFLWAATAYLIKGIDINILNTETTLNLVIIFSTFTLLNLTKFPTPLIVLICLFLGWIF